VEAFEGTLALSDFSCPFSQAVHQPRAGARAGLPWPRPSVRRSWAKAGSMGRHKPRGWQVGELAEPEVGDGNEVGGNAAPRAARVACCIRLFMASSKALLRVWVRRMNTPLKPTPMAPACQGGQRNKRALQSGKLEYPARKSMGYKRSELGGKLVPRKCGPGWLR